MHPNASLITRFYSAFQRRDAAGMIDCYDPNVTFSDPVFVSLHGARAGQMWTMLCAIGTDMQVTYHDVNADDHAGSAHWEAIYTFSRTGRRVHNVVEAHFQFREGKIIEHRDRFSFRRWSSQALGLPGVLLGWAPLLQKKVQAESARRLSEYTAANPPPTVDADR